MATTKPSRPLYDGIPERVIKIEAVQRYRAAVTDDHTAQFFEGGRVPELWGDFFGPWTGWSLSRRKMWR